ncbi:MAG: hypothetical protein M3Z54_08000 [Gemmatimonadota bacterium]|nr:hypothetical protein [Gemmatimonadota bacterium]
MQRLRAGVSLIATFATAASVAHAQEVLETPKTRVEVLGLKRWTVPMIQDSLVCARELHFCSRVSVPARRRIATWHEDSWNI